MTTHSQKGCIVIECDGCDETHEGIEGEPWAYVWGQAKHEGWRAVQSGGVWSHFCPKHKRAN